MLSDDSCCVAGDGADTVANELVDARRDADGRSLAMRRRKLKLEMQSIEKSEDKALLHIKHKMSDLNDAGGGYVPKLIAAANKASPDDSHPVEFPAKTQLLAAKPKHALAVAAARHGTSEHVHAHAHAHAHAQVARASSVPRHVDTDKGVAAKAAKNAEHRSRGTLSEAAFKAVEDLAREGDADVESKRPASHAHTSAHHVVVRQPAEQKAGRHTDETHVVAASPSKASAATHAGKPVAVVKAGGNVKEANGAPKLAGAASHAASKAPATAPTAAGRDPKAAATAVGAGTSGSKGGAKGVKAVKGGGAGKKAGGDEGADEVTAT